MPVLGAFQVSLSCDGVVLNEYPAGDGPDKVTPDDDHNATAYVEAIEDEEFEIVCNIDENYQLPNGCNALSVDFQVDGVKMGGRIVNATRISQGHEVRYEGREHGSGDTWYLQPFRFGKLEITQETSGYDVKELNRRIDDLGRVQVTVWTYYREGNDLKSTQEGQRLQQNSIPEKVLKGRAVTLNTQLGETRPVPKRTTARGSVIDLIATFNLLYRSRESLYQTGILERPPSPVPLEDRDLDTLSASELRQLLRAQKAERKKSQNLKMEQQRKVKRERSPVDDDDLSEIPNPRKRTAPSEEVEAIEIDSD